MRETSSKKENGTKKREESAHETSGKGPLQSSHKQGQKMKKIKKKALTTLKKQKTTSHETPSCGRYFCDSCLFKNFDNELPFPNCEYCKRTCFCKNCTNEKFIERAKQVQTKLGCPFVNPVF